ncbi:MAG: hypothetical protein QM619_00130 [Micropruina sp.]|uniref:hypothetical protein n=1 Tax=Micropruina sp. TaxID=2737536 RepID=UPI0039E4D506
MAGVAVGDGVGVDVDTGVGAGDGCGSAHAVDELATPLREIATAITLESHTRTLDDRIVVPPEVMHGPGNISVPKRPDDGVGAPRIKIVELEHRWKRVGISGEEVPPGYWFYSKDPAGSVAKRSEYPAGVLTFFQHPRNCLRGEGARRRVDHPQLLEEHRFNSAVGFGPLVALEQTTVPPGPTPK